MGEITEISWCDSTFNPWWGCVKVSPGCANCYAATFDKRVGGEHWGAAAERRFFGDKHWDEPRKWNAKAHAAGIRKRVFCASMCDVFEDRSDLSKHRERLWSLIDKTLSLDWLLLTKRPENIQAMIPTRWRHAVQPISNVWIGCTAEDAARAQDRIPILALETWARYRFVSCEPMLGIIDLGLIDDRSVAAIDWVICGGESGAGARSFHLGEARFLRKQCANAGIAFFFKQTGDNPADTNDDVVRPRPANKGGNLVDIPNDLRVRQFPDTMVGLHHARR